MTNTRRGLFGLLAGAAAATSAVAANIFGLRKLFARKTGTGTYTVALPKDAQPNEEFDVWIIP